MPNRPADVHVQMQFGIVAEGMVQVQYGALLFVAGGIPPDVAIGETAALVAVEVMPGGLLSPGT